MGSKQYGIDPKRLEQYSLEIKKVSELGTEVAIVIGGATFFVELKLKVQDLTGSRVIIWGC